MPYQHSTNNVVAFPQNPNMLVKTVCLLPENLYRVLTVQFVCDDPTVVCKDPVLVVDLVLVLVLRGIQGFETCSSRVLVSTAGDSPLAYLSIEG